jgi:predicted nucleic-acid-binding Zn-ribbon protein
LDLTTQNFDMTNGRGSMKNDRKCSKCSSSSVEYADRIFSGGGFGGREYIGLGPKLAGGMESRFSAYICNNCGHAELYLVRNRG